MKDLQKLGMKKKEPKTKQLTDTRQKSLKILKDFQFTENWKNVQNNKAGENMSKIAGSWEKKNGTKICRNKDLFINTECKETGQKLKKDGIKVVQNPGQRKPENVLI